MNFCASMSLTETGLQEDVAFANWVTLNYAKEKCLDHDYYKRVNRLRNSNWTINEAVKGEKQKLYMQCTQLGTFPISDNGDTLFGRTISWVYYYNLCTDAFGFR